MLCFSGDSCFVRPDYKQRLHVGGKKKADWLLQLDRKTEKRGWELNDGLFWWQVMTVNVRELGREAGRNKEDIIFTEEHVWYLYILEMLVQMSGSLWWWRSTRQSSGSIEKETKSGRESAWSARFLKVAVSYRGHRADKERGAIARSNVH